MQVKKILFRDGPFNFQGGGYAFFLKKYSDSRCCLKKYSDFSGGEKNNLIQSFCHIFVKFATEKKKILTLVKKKF
jgi:hypothetical protein